METGVEREREKGRRDNESRKKKQVQKSGIKKHREMELKTGRKNGKDREEVEER